MAYGAFGLRCTAETTPRSISRGYRLSKEPNGATLTVVSGAPLLRTFAFLKHMEHEGFSNKKSRSERVPKGIPYARIERAREEVSDITDGLNLSIDEGIREAVAVLRALNVGTTQSCEGHLDQGSPSPYIDIQAPDEPIHRFQGEVEQLQALADKYEITPGDVRSWPSDEDQARRAKLAYDEWITWCGEGSREETSEYTEWDRADQFLRANLDGLIADFYAMRPRPAEGYVLLEHDRLRTASNLYDRYIAAASRRTADPLSQADRKHLRIFLPVAQTEMQAFIGFLKANFFQSTGT